MKASKFSVDIGMGASYSSKFKKEFQKTAKHHTESTTVIETEQIFMAPAGKFYGVYQTHAICTSKKPGDSFEYLDSYYIVEHSNTEE